MSTAIADLGLRAAIRVTYRAYQATWWTFARLASTLCMLQGIEHRRKEGALD